jgi:Zn-finger protein
MNYKHFVHEDCAFFPCHELEDWASCLFCWCPLYLLECDGDFTLKNGIKDCSGCVIPHTKEGYDYILDVVRRDVFGGLQAAQLLSRSDPAGRREDKGLYGRHRAAEGGRG